MKTNQATETAPVLELTVPPDGRIPVRTLTVRFGDLVSSFLSEPEAQDGDLERLAAAADFLHCVFSGGPALDTPADGHESLASFVLSLTDAVLDAALRILGYEPDYDDGYHGILHTDPRADHLGRMMRLTDHLDPAGHAFGSILSATLAAPPAEDPSAGSELTAALAAATTASAKASAAPLAAPDGEAV